ncbi:phytase [Gillisia marina]|uniref:phytase n=1 Tax=Gillisia marina TaxID=1167637 RepID=UPI00029AAE9A|nr:phytase [Gillisia marina]
MKRIVYVFMGILLFSIILKEDTIAPDIITQTVKYDPDDPAIWINKLDSSKSIVFGTDKGANGAIYAFDLQGRIIKEKTIKDLNRPNNVDVEYDFCINDSTKIDLLAFTERGKKQVRIFSIPDMKPLDQGGFKVFENELDSHFKSPMGLGIYLSRIDGSYYVIVGRKDGPKEGYLYQYKIDTSPLGLDLNLIRKFGNFSGKKEIEAIAIDDEMGMVYYSDETHCVRKYFAEPSYGNEELACFGLDHFKGDNEGIAILPRKNGKGYIIVSNQKNNTFSVFSRTDNRYLKELHLSTLESDGCELVTVALNEEFRNGLFVAMNDQKNFYFYDLKKLDLP